MCSELCATLKRLALICALFLGALAPAQPAWHSVLQVVTPSGFTPSCTQSNNFLARATNVTLLADKQNYDNLICGLVTDSVFLSIDVLYIFAAPDSVTAALNLIASNSAATLTGTPTFTAYQGYTGLSSTNNFVSPTLTLSNCVRDSCSIGAWAYTGLGSQNNSLINISGTQVIVPDNGGSAIAIITAASGGVAGTTANSGRGFYVGERSASTTQTIYVNGSSAGTNSTASTGTPATTPNIPKSTTTFTVSVAFWSSSLGGTKQTALYNRLATYMTAVGATVP
jgi:hypothetical protein